MSKKAKILISTYAVAAITALSLFSWSGYDRLGDYRELAKNASRLSFNETVDAMDRLGKAMGKSLYASDGSMCTAVCAESYAAAQAAEATLATLPFSTHELERISSFVGLAGDYAYALCREAAEQGFSDEQRDNLEAMAETASELAQTMRQVQTELNRGQLSMDEQEQRLANVEADEKLQKLSERLIDCESDFPVTERIHYDGRYSATEERENHAVSEEETRKIAADFLKSEADELKLDCEYENGALRSYSVDGIYLLAGEQGVQSMHSSRLVGEGVISPEDAENIAEKFLSGLGYEELELCESSKNGNIARFSFGASRDGAVCLGGLLQVAVALDDGSVYSFDASEYYKTGELEGEWIISEEEAAESLAGDIKLQSCRKVWYESAGDRMLPCYELSCTNPAGEQVKIYINAENGRQQEILTA